MIVYLYLNQDWKWNLNQSCYMKKVQTFDKILWNFGISKLQNQNEIAKNTDY